MGVFLLPIALVRMAVATAMLCLAAAKRWPGPTLVVLSLLWLASGGRI